MKNMCIYIYIYIYRPSYILGILSMMGFEPAIFAPANQRIIHSATLTIDSVGLRGFERSPNGAPTMCTSYFVGINS